MEKNKTICAISTPIGNGGISIVRMSGCQSKKILQKIVDFDTEKMEARKMYLTKIHTKNFDEQGLIVWFKEPYSYTGEEMVEIQCHGGIIIANGILNELLEKGAVLAESGEFTKRAFVNGKMSLDSAEGIIDMINAQSEEAVKAGYNLMTGKLKEQVESIQNLLTNCEAKVEVALDYPEEDIDYSTSKEIKDELEVCRQKIDELLATANTGRLVKNGINILILGKPNAGKSSLLNALVGFSRAIVTDIAGTTRDMVEDSYTYKNLSFNVIDTAGIRETESIVERIGIERAEESVKGADLILVVLDGSKPIENDDEKILKMVKDKIVLYVVNKIDLPKKINRTFDQMIEISAMRNERVMALKEDIYNLIVDKNMLNGGLIITNTRHISALKEANKSIISAIKEIELGTSLDLVATDIKAAWLSLGEITGVVNNQEIINTIFSKFCLGK
ncbi:MAG TPA: tRNA uridine-5-carboxymethylaminomethyl(34) synthesis GTPase MnmE [Clostridiales bacterium]|nr:tRNA uridine-5-carboxymethylaminomethyl(34) synthesis GTPase MnmE [Clostridiales bacterium]